MQKTLIFVLLCFAFISCREIEEKYLYDADDPRIIDLQKDKCLQESIYEDIKLVNDFSRYTVGKTYLFKRTEKIGNETESIDAKWGIHITEIAGGSMTVSIRKPQEVYHLTYLVADSGDIVDIVTQGTCTKDKYGRTKGKNNISFVHTLQKVIEASDDPDENPVRYDEFKRNFSLHIDYPALFYYFRGSVTIKKIHKGTTNSTTTFTHSLSELDCTKSDNSRYCNLTGQAEDGSALNIFNCNATIPDLSIYNLKTVSNNEGEATLVKFTPEADCGNILF